jgi:hypothetical protein
MGRLETITKRTNDCYILDYVTFVQYSRMLKMRHFEFICLCHKIQIIPTDEYRNCGVMT